MATDTATSSRTGIEQGILDLERQYWQAIQDNDIDGVLKLTDDPCYVAGAQGVKAIDHATFRSMLESPSSTVERFDIQDAPLVSRVSDDVVLVAYQVRRDLIVKGKPVTLEAADTSTWVRKGGRWLCVMHTESIKADPFGQK